MSEQRLVDIAKRAARTGERVTVSFTTCLEEDGAVTFRCVEENPSPYPFLLPAFLKAMNDIGEYGEQKYGEHSFLQRAKRGDMSRDQERTSTATIVRHAVDHAYQYAAGVPHDHFNDALHQLAAAAFNMMMEAHFAGLAKEDHDAATGK